MRVVINGWFSEQLTTGSGQYLTALLEWLPWVGGHALVGVSQARISRGAATSKSPKSESANQETANRQISKSANCR